MGTLIRLWHLAITLYASAHIGIATNFSQIDDPQNPDPYAACLQRDLRDTDLIIAHPTLPCNTKVWIYNLRTHRSVVVTVGDRGPRHAMVDLAPAATRALRANGEDIVIMQVIE